MGEFELIDSIVSQLGSSSQSPDVVLGPGDDAAIVAVPADQQLVTSVDTLVADLHFPRLADPELIAQRALRVSVSDLAAMGATPLAALVALVLPKSTDPNWVESLSRGFGTAARELGCPITGGNLTAGQLALSVTVQGCAPADTALLRGGAAAGDDVWVSGPLGGAASALAAGGIDVLTPEALEGLPAARCYFLPEPQLRLGVNLRGIASSAIDISDGLAADLGHIAKQSAVAVELYQAAIPLFDGATLEQALHGGDDYQLCFTSTPENAGRVRECAPHASLIGRCVSPLSLGVDSQRASLLLDGKPLAPLGFDHFRAS